MITESVTFESILQEAFVVDNDRGCTLEPARRHTIYCLLNQIQNKSEHKIKITRKWGRKSNQQEIKDKMYCLDRKAKL